jgi:hypothetical protein
MSEASVTQAREGATLRGRFAIFGEGLNTSVAWTSDLCDQCSACTCGTQQKPWDVKSIIADMMRHPLQFRQFMHGMMGESDDGA